MSEEFDKAIMEADRVISGIKAEQHAFLFGFVAGVVLTTLVAIMVVVS